MCAVMPQYIRAKVPGASYFFTVALLERDQELLTENISALRNSFRAVRAGRPFSIDAIVILPDHLHCIWTLPGEDADFSTRWRLVKARFSRAINADERRSSRRIQKGERGVWQRRFWEHLICNDGDMAAHIDYIHYNPVKHGWVSQVSEWPYSSFQRYVKNGVYPGEWAAGNEVINMDLG